jgi:hypothetical protein
MIKEKSFIGEYSVGLSMVLSLKVILHERYRYVTPIFPWITREGSNISKYIHTNDQFRIFGIYPRRPKLTQDKTDIEFKFNQQILNGANRGLKLGLPIIAGCPIVRNFWELSDNPIFLWIKVGLSGTEEFSFKVVGDSPNFTGLSNDLLLHDQEILSFIDLHSKIFSIQHSIEAFKEISRDSLGVPYYSRFVFGGIYKPIYFLLKENE